MTNFQRVNAVGTPGGLPVAAASRRQSLQGKHACEDKKRNLHDLLERNETVIPHGPIWKTLFGPGEQLETRGEYGAAKKAYTLSIETIAAPTSDDDDAIYLGEALNEDGAP